MKKILLILLLVPLFVKAQVVLPIRDTIRPSNIGAAYTPTFSDAMQNGILTHYVRRGTSNVYDFMPSSKYLRANYGQLAGGNTWYDFQNFLGAIAYSYATNTSYAGTLVAGDNASGQYKIGNINNSGFGGLTTFANSVAEWRIGRIPGGDFGWQRWNGTTWVSSIVTSADGTSTTINGSPVLTNANSYNKTQQDSIYQRLVNRYDSQTIAGDKSFTGLITANGVVSQPGFYSTPSSANTEVYTAQNGQLRSGFSPTTFRVAEDGGTGNKETYYRYLGIGGTRMYPSSNQYAFNILYPTADATRTDNIQFQPKSGTVALLSDITGASGATYSKSYIDSADATKESLSNKTNTLTNSTTQYPTTQAVTNALAGYTINTRAINTGVGLLGGGNLSADRTLTADTTTLATKAYGNNQWVTRSTAQNITGLKTFGSSILPLTNATYSLGNSGSNWLVGYFNGVQSNTSLSFNTVNSNGIVYNVGGVEKARFSPTNGFLLLGTTTDNGVDRLQVVGSANISTLLRFNAITPTANQIYGVNAAGTIGEAKTITAGSGINVSNTAGTITIAAQSNVVEITGTSQTAAGNTIYIPHNASLTTITVPATTTIGTLYQVIGEGAGGWKLQLPSGYTAVGVGSFTTTSGGSLNSSDKNCTITIRLTNTNKFTVTTSQGTINPL